MNTETLSLLAMDQIAGSGITGPNFEFDLIHLFQKHKPLEFIRPDHIMTSSVGEFYEEKMKGFVELAKDVFDYVMEDTGSDFKAFHMAMQVIPLGAVGGVSCNEHTYLQRKKLFELWSYPLPELREFPVLKRTWSSYAEDDAKDSYLKRTMVIEQVAQSICVGYIPNTEVPVIERLKHDSSFFKEYLIADLLYPWVTQPLKQLRMLVPSLEPSTIKMVLNAGVPSNREMVSGCVDGPHSYSYDCITDFFSYVCLRMSRTAYSMSIRNQFWTPFFGIADYETIKATIKDPALLTRVEQAFLISKRLYVEVVKTGLKYEAQYAVLGGMAGRYTISGSMAAMLDFTHKSEKRWSTNISKTVTKYIFDSLDIDWWDTDIKQ